MEALPYVLSFAAVCFMCSFGLIYRTIWMWYLGWVFFYLLASYYGTFFFNALYSAKDDRDAAFACVYLAGGLLIWLPCAVWWATHRDSFGIRGTRDKPKLSNN